MDIPKSGILFEKVRQVCEKSTNVFQYKHTHFNIIYYIEYYISSISSGGVVFGVSRLGRGRSRAIPSSVLGWSTG